MTSPIFRPMNPGTPEAKAQGCKCPGLPNHQAGVPGHACVHPANGHDHAEWVVSDKCPIHWGGYQYRPITVR